MAKMMLAAFDDQTKADRAISKLEDRGYMPEQISVISNNQKYQSEGHTDTEDAMGSAGRGAATGGVIGGLAGLLAGVGVVPALAGLFIGGPIVGALGLAGIAATTAAGAVTGAAAGGLIGALTKAGVSKDTATSYDKMVREGGVVLGLTGNDEMTDEARDILDDNGAQDISFVDMHEESSAAMGVDSAREDTTTDNHGMRDTETKREFPAGRPQPSFGERRNMSEEDEKL